eukprot:5598361-Pyramimonas_sp.AAC.1
MQEPGVRQQVCARLRFATYESCVIALLVTLISLTLAFFCGGTRVASHLGFRGCPLQGQMDSQPYPVHIRGLAAGPLPGELG